MASVLSFDELNRLGIERRSVPYREWFSAINLPKARIARRVEIAEAVESAVMDWMYFVAVMLDENGYFNTAMATNVLNEALHEAVPVDDESYLDIWLRDLAQELTDSTQRNIADPYFLSEDRATVIAENQAQTIAGYEEYEDAEMRGFTFKTWHGMLDNRERETHVESEGQTVPINEDFFVGENSYFIMPCVPSEAGADPEEYVNCRCWATFE